MTPRQQEFCRLFATGMVATKAAIAAGYSSSTASQNCAAMLKNPTIKARLHELEKRAYTSHHDILHFKNVLNDIVSREQNNSIVIRAIQALIKLTAIPLPHFITDSTHLHSSTSNIQSPYPINYPTIPDKLSEQPLDYQENVCEEENIEDIDPAPVNSVANSQISAPGLAYEFTIVQAVAPNAPPQAENDFHPLADPQYDS